ncbi:bifunctional D-glycero-beta-D-manno-heptose-7-phosphate kinase/D-glycero-beta-D-manno-heptose 1-phosphate adenylyltransferase HldE [Woeseia oceani]|uniref:Bifunctional protein HldE n=1 Tax=Woeseia oceani TaxID=1548547 RepID=A0A193LIL1_9GAMM|nr:bifunctional D-glycero-beta-D-manno-heptose-7-phosphate kinase/D-glycero-beta-D-manno-heptose 1-phosphate adenylyltransferase HldE [Woeseia oceani]ANO52234.1 bifunctional heptose 7-phosphate kinase/heptose 1-phosphate adenyltransferase [Woeseia oceani]
MTLTIPDFSDGQVLVAGDVMLDRYLFGGTSRISPEAPVPVVHIQDEDARPGGAANVAVNLSSLGVRTQLLGVVGDDDDANCLEGLLQPRGIKCDFVRVPGQPTITKTRVQSRGQQLIRLDREERLAAGSERLLESLSKKVADSRVVILSDYGKGTLADVQQMIAVCRAAGCAVMIDPKGSDFERYRGATLLTPNQSEFEVVAGRCETDEQLIERATAMVDDLDLEALLVTRSEKGMLLIERGEEPFLLSTQAREVFDVTGAGDTVIATLAAAVAAGTALSSAASLANLAAGLVVRKIGVASVTRSELQVALHQRGQGGRGLVTEAELSSMVSESRQRNERVVMTNGCFDVLHAGHVAYLEEAKALGDRLIVAVNDDDSVRRLKGESRPINALPDRMAVLAGLAAVDWVVPFSEDTPARLISAIKPQVLVKGGDYTASEIAGAKDVLAAGGEVRVLSFRDGHSSSRIIQRLED